MMVPPPAAAEGGDRRLGGDPHAGEIDVDDRPPFLEREVDRGRHLRRDAGVGDDDVEAAEALDGVVGGALHGVEIGDVGGTARRLAAGGRDLGHDVGQRLGTATGDRDRGTLGGEGDGDGRADAGAAAGDQRDLAREVTHGCPRRSGTSSHSEAADPAARTRRRSRTRAPVLRRQRR